jgi:hypothetical protein
MRGSAVLSGHVTSTGKRNRRLPFDKSNPALPDWECTPRPGDVTLDEFKVGVELGHSQFQIRTVASELGQHPPAYRNVPRNENGKELPKTGIVFPAARNVAISRKGSAAQPASPSMS